ncbi:MAG: tetratricopeptide repeat protein, partial [Devosia sp.]
MADLSGLRGGMLAPALSYLEQGSVDRAFRAYRALRKHEPRNAGIAFNFANALAARGLTKEAEQEYRNALEAEPRAPDILNNLAALIGESGRHQEALELCDRGLISAPGHSRLLLNRARQKLALGQFEAAGVDIEALLALAPAMYEAHNLKGELLARQSKWALAIDAFKQALELSGNDRQVRINLGSAYAANGALEDAVAMFTAALRQERRDVTTLSALGAALQRMGKHQEAINACELALRLKPDFAEAHNRITTSYLTMEQWQKAIETGEEVLKRHPNHQEGLYNLGSAYIGGRRYKDAIACFDAILAAGPKDDMALLNLGNALAGAGRIQDAIEAYDRMIASLPHWAGGYLNRGHAYGKQLRWEEALADYRKAAELEPKKTDHLYSIGNVYLHRGQFEEGWKGYEYRNKSSEGVQLRFPDIPVWNGEDLTGKRIVVFHEQGLGDNIQMARYLPLLQQRGAEVSFHGYPILHALFQTAAPGLKTIDQVKAEDYDFQVATMSLPFKFGTRVDTVPQNVPYFTADPERVAKWRDRIGTHGFRIGMNWQGNPTGKIDEGRSAPLAQFLRFAEIPGVRLIAMQKNHGLDQLKDVPDH